MKLILLKSLIEDKIEDHFTDEYEIIEDQEDFDFDFEFDNHTILVPYSFRNGEIIYKNEWISATNKEGITYCDEDSDKFEIRRKDYNPKSKPLQVRIDEIMEYKQRKQDERDEDARNIQLDQDLMRGSQ